MMHLKLGEAGSGALQVLCLGAHSDDIEIGCGGAVLQLAQRYPECSFHWAVFSATGVRKEEARRAAILFAGAERLKTLMLHAFQDGFLPFVGGEVKAVFEELKRTTSPDIIFTHNRQDAHQDHRLIAELTWNTFRSHFILEYEIPKYDGDLGQPTAYVTLSKDECHQKVENIIDLFQSQQAKRWFERDTFLSLMRLRGMECNALSGYAEAFYCRKLVI